jgi:proteasome accessory factor A
MSQFATALKIGTTALVLDLIEQGKAPALELATPIETTRALSRDTSYRWLVPLRDGRTISAVDIQRLYLSAAREHADLGDEDTRWLLAEWEQVLDDLSTDVMLCRDRIDWVAKKFLLTTFQESEKLDWSDPWLQSIDLEYHNVSWEQGLFYELLREGQMRRLVSEEEVKEAIFHPPETTRAFFRGRAVARFNREISSIQWDEIGFSAAGATRTVGLPQPANDLRLEELNAAVREARTFEEMEKRIFG